MKKKYFFLQGSSMFEVVLALGVMTIIIVGVIILTLFSVRNASFARDKNLASKYAQEATEWLRGQRDQNVSNFLLLAQSPEYCLDQLSFNNVGSCSQTEFIQNTKFIRNLIFEKNLSMGKSIVNAKIIVSWEDSQGYHEARSTTDFTDIREQ